MTLKSSSRSAVGHAQSTITPLPRSRSPRSCSVPVVAIDPDLNKYVHHITYDIRMSKEDRPRL